MGRKWKKSFSPKTRKMRPRRKRAMTEIIYIGRTELGDSDFRVLEALLHKGPLPVNTLGPKVWLTPGSISVAVAITPEFFSGARSTRFPWKTSTV
jgi:hypothetical protein